MLPFFETKIDAKTPEATEVWKILNIAKTEASMIVKHLYMETTIKLIEHYFDILILPESSLDITKKFVPCFYKNQKKAENFVKLLSDLIWEYNFINKTFVEQFTKIFFGKEVKTVLIFGGAFHLSMG